MLADRKLYLVTPVRPGFGEFLAAAIRGGVDVVQVRDRSLADGRLLDALGEARVVTAAHGIPLGVNDRPDLAVLAGADFVHVGQDDIPVEAARAFGLPVGLSTHAPAEIDAARADYIAVGPVHATPTKEGRPAVGLELVRYAAANCDSPLVRHRRHRRPQTSRTSLRPARPGSPSFGQSSRRTTRSERPGSSARRFPTSRAGGSWRP